MRVLVVGATAQNRAETLISFSVQIFRAPCKISFRSLYGTTIRLSGDTNSKQNVTVCQFGFG